MNNRVDALDVDMMTENGVFQSLLKAVAAGRLFVLNGAGGYEQISAVTYWREGELFTTHNGGQEVDEDGNITRDFADKDYG